MSVQDILINGKISPQYYNGSTFPNIDIDQVTGLEAALTVITDDIADINNSVGQPDGICPLNSSGKVSLSYMDPSIFTFLGAWDASIGVGGVPTLTNGTGDMGDMYIVSVGGVQFGETFIPGDFVVYANGLWEKIASGGNSVTSVTAGTNVSISGTSIAPVVNVVASPSFTQVSSTAPVPLTAGDLTRKDYVDNFINNASNLGFANGDVFKQKSGNTLQFRRLNTNGTVSITTNNLTDTVDIETDKSLIGLSNVSNEKNNFTAILPPTSANNDTQGYSVASRWIDTNLNKEYVCMNAVGLAVWVETTQQSAGEVNTASNVGAGSGVFKTKVGTDLQFKSLVQTSNQVLIASGSDTLTLSTPQDINTTANMNLSSVTLSQAAGNAVNVTGANSLIRLGGLNSAIINNGVNGNMDRVDISRGTRYWYMNNLSNAAMNVTNSTTTHTINISNQGGGNDQNSFCAVSCTPRYFPFGNVQNVRGDLTQTSVYCAWKINAALSITSVRFGIMSDDYLKSYGSLVTGSSNRRGLYNAGDGRQQVVTTQFTPTGGSIHQNDDRNAVTIGTPYTSGLFTTNDIVILQSVLSNPPRLYLHSYGFSGGVATWKTTNTCDLRSGSMVGSDTCAFGQPYVNLQVIAANVDLLGARWLDSNISSWVHTGNGGLFNNTTALSYYY